MSSTLVGKLGGLVLSTLQAVCVALQSLIHSRMTGIRKLNGALSSLLRQIC